MEAVMRQRHAVGLPWRRGDQWGATHATFAGQEQAAAAFERTARPAPRERRRVRKRSVVLKQPPVRERVRRGAQIKKPPPNPKAVKMMDICNYCWPCSPA